VKYFKTIILTLLLCITVLVFVQSKFILRDAVDPFESGLEVTGFGEEGSDEEVTQKIMSFSLEGYRDDGEKKWELNGLCADILSNIIKLDYVTAKAYGEEATMTLTAKSGIYDKVTQDVHLEENIVGESSDGTRLFTDVLDWNQKTESVTTDALVRIEKENLVSIGKGASGNPDLKEVKLKKDITVELREEPPTVITCDGPLLVNYERNISTLKNNVKIADERGEIVADEMKVLFDPDTKKITRVVAIGNVRIQREGNVTHSERAIYTVRDGRVRLIGKPKIVVVTK